MIREPNFNVVKSRVPKICVCPVCKVEQPFRNGGEKVKDMDLETPTQLMVRVVRAKCQNPDCKTKRFALPIAEISRAIKKGSNCWPSRG